MPGPLLVDLTCVCDAHTDLALETIAKAMGEDPTDADIWAPHPNPYINRIVELFTQRGLHRIAGVQQELRKWLSGDMHERGKRMPRPDGSVATWAEGELTLVRTYLRALQPEEFTLDDWMLLVDYLVQRYLPAAVLQDEAIWLASRSAIMGRIHAAMGDDVDLGAADHLLSAMQREKAPVSEPLAAAIEYGSARACEDVTKLSDNARHAMRKLVVDHQEAAYLGDTTGPGGSSLETRLGDQFGALNRDWRRIAVTEATEMEGQGFISSQPLGARVRRVERYRGACAWCRSIDGKVCEVVSPSAPDKDGEGQVWVGKTNRGRFASSRKRVASGLVEREDGERYWIAAGGQHPNCRGSWVRASGATPDPVFDEWVATHLERRELPA